MTFKVYQSKRSVDPFQGWSIKDLKLLHSSRYYENFLKWDLTLEGSRGPDHIFFFTLRDASNLGWLGGKEVQRKA